MIRAKLAAAGITDVSVTMKEAVSSSWTYVGIAADGTIQYKWNPNGTTSASEGNVRPTVVLSCQGTDGKTYTRESTGCYFIIGLDEAKAMAALRTAERIERGNIVVVFPDRAEKYLSTQMFARFDD